MQRKHIIYFNKFLAIATSFYKRRLEEQLQKYPFITVGITEVNKLLTRQQLKWNDIIKMDVTGISYV
jgi:hypothetical protein